MIRTGQFFFSVLLAFILIIKPVETSRACGFDPDDLFYGFSFFDPAITAQPGYSPLFFSFDRFYDYTWTDTTTLHQSNILEWQKFFSDKPSYEDIYYVVYKASDNALIETKKYVDNTGGEVPEELRDNSLVEFWKKKKFSSPICYLVFAKQCEPHVYRDPYSWEQPERDASQMETLLGEGLERYDAAKNKFLKLRYGFQVVRLAHYTGRYEDCIRFHDELVEPLKEKADSELYYWSLGHKAGALKELGRNQQAAYLFSLVFDKSPAKRVPAWMSFHIGSDADWQAVMDLCQNDQEKANLYFMRGIDPESRVVEEMRAIYALDPGSEKLDILLAREINKLEYDFFGWDFDFQFPLKTEYDGTSKENALKYLAELSDFVQARNQEGKLHSPSLWKMAEGYLAFMRADFDRADQIIAVEARNTGDQKLQQYASLFRWIISVSRMESIDQRREERLYSEWAALDFKDDPHQLKEKSREYLMKTAARLYQLQGEPGKAFLCTSQLYYLLTGLDEKVIDDLLTWTRSLQSRQPTSMEKYLLSQIGDNHQRETLMMLKATVHIRNQQLEEAIALMETVPENVRKNATGYYIPSDPFKAYNLDCLGCEDDQERGPFNKLSFVKRLMELESEAVNNPEKAAENYLLLGNAWYNITYFGPAWQAAAYYRSGSEWYGFGEEESSYRKESQGIYTNMEIPESYYQKAIDHASASGNRELAAVATFMAAKCEQNRFYLAGNDDENDLEHKPEYRTRFDELIADYSDTDYYNQVLNECSFLNTYVWLKK